MTSNLTTRSARSALILAASATLFVGCATTNAARTHNDASRVAISARAAAVDTLVQQWASLEITRAEKRVVYERWAPESRTIDDQIAALQEVVIGAGSDAQTSRRALQSVLDALDGRQVTLAAKHRDLLVTYVPTSATVRSVAEQEGYVEQRRAELRASLMTTSQANTR